MVTQCGAQTQAKTGEPHLSARKRHASCPVNMRPYMWAYMRANRLCNRCQKATLRFLFAVFPCPAIGFVHLPTSCKTLYLEGGRERVFDSHHCFPLPLCSIKVESTGNWYLSPPSSRCFDPIPALRATHSLSWQSHKHQTLLRSPPPRNTLSRLKLMTGMAIQQSAQWISPPLPRVSAPVF